MNHEKYLMIVKRFGLAIAFVAVFILGAFLGTKESFAKIITPENKNIAVSETVDLSEFWKVWKLLDEKYPFKKESPHQSEKVYGAIAGLVASYNDPYTTFFPPKEAKLFNEQVKGVFGGVGMEVGVKDDFITVIAPIKNTPAEQAGILAGDIITSVDTTDTSGMDLDTVISLIRGEVGTKVTLGIIRKGEPEVITKELVRQIITIPVIETKKEGDVFIISFYSFSENSAVLFTDALKQFKTSGKTKLVIDLRNNPGGYLDSALEIASYFLAEGKTIVRENFGTESAEIIHQSKGYSLLTKKPKIMVLINNGSASASEILAGALQEHNVATIVGTQSFGKGSVQELIDLPDKSAIKITIAKWLTPKGVSISEKGITPDVVVKEQPILNKKTNIYSDPVLEKAITLLKGR